MVKNIQGLSAWTANVHTNKLPLHKFGFAKKSKKSVHVRKSVPKEKVMGERVQSLPGKKIFNSHLPNSTNMRVQLKPTILASKNEPFHKREMHSALASMK